MGRRKRRKGRHESERRARASDGGSAPTQATTRRERKPIVPWRDRSSEVLRRLRGWSRENHGPAIESHLRKVFGDEADAAPLEDLERAFDDFVCLPSSAGNGRSIVRAFAEEADGLEKDERAQLPAWEEERHRRVYLVDRAHRDHFELWDPVRGGRLSLHLLQRMATGHAAALERGTVVIAVAVPWGTRQIGLGRVEVYDDDEALDLYRREVRGQGRVWHDLPSPVPRG